MIQILTVKDKQQRANFCAKAGVCDSPDLSVIAVFDENEIPENGAVFHYSGEHGEILWLEMNEDLDLSVGLGKSILSIMELRGVKEVSLPLHYEKLAKALRFEKHPDAYRVQLEGYFGCCCQHK